jgi:hypothetical protein
VARQERQKPTAEPKLVSAATSPLVFISHDARDAELAEAFSKLLKSVSAGMIKTFRSSDKKGTEGIDFGDEWYKRLMEALQSTSDVVCLFTERSLERPWILFEAGVAKGKLGTPVVGVALGVPLSRISAGPFYQFMNMDDSEADLSKLVHQLARRIPNLELDDDVVKLQVAAFKSTEAEILKALTTGGSKKETKSESEESAIAKLVEEMKGLPSRVAERLLETGDPFRRRRMRRFHPMMLEEMLHTSGDTSDPIGVLMAASLVRDDAPWLYELAMEVYRSLKSGDMKTIKRELERLRRISEVGLKGPFFEELEYSGRDQMVLMEFPRMLQRAVMRTLEAKELQPRRQASQPEPKEP